MMTAFYFYIYLLYVFLVYLLGDYTYEYPYHAVYFAHELTRQGGDGVERLSRSLFDACVDLNPHQIEAALFALRSPITKGVLLADEVGLGKTIEAGLILCQNWAERHRRLLVICRHLLESSGLWNWKKSFTCLAFFWMPGHIVNPKKMATRILLLLRE